MFFFSLYFFFTFSYSFFILFFLAASSGVPWCALRIVSDAADERFDPSEILALLKGRLSGELAALVVAMVARWPTGQATPRRAGRLTLHARRGA
jgi:hypothetical protein